MPSGHTHLKGWGWGQLEAIVNSIELNHTTKELQLLTKERDAKLFNLLLQ